MAERLLVVGALHPWAERLDKGSWISSSVCFVLICGETEARDSVVDPVICRVRIVVGIITTIAVPIVSPSVTVIISPLHTSILTITCDDD
ncbi:hypothetical protein H671_7g17356 [Cricetulus griseus]|nr:hypothetical protein H671_7g17356 [Cricetulus griseus]